MMIAGTTNVGPENQMLYKDERCMNDNKRFIKYSLSSSTTKARAPATLHLAFRDPGSGKFQALEVTPLSSPLELPDIMKEPESQSHEQTVA